MTNVIRIDSMIQDYVYDKYTEKWFCNVKRKPTPLKSNNNNSQNIDKFSNSREIFKEGKFYFQISLMVFNFSFSVSTRFRSSCFIHKKMWVECCCHWFGWCMNVLARRVKKPCALCNRMLRICFSLKSYDDRHSRGRTWKMTRHKSVELCTSSTKQLKFFNSYLSFPNATFKRNHFSRLYKSFRQRECW